MKRIIGHLDMDAFFASVEEKVNPHFNGRPIVVGSDPMNGRGRGVVSTASYKARAYGIKSALPISKAWQLSQEAKGQGKPEAVFLLPDMPLYERVSESVFEIVRSFSDSVEPASIDEIYFDLSYLESYKKAELICKKIKEKIKAKEGITCSIGIGPNKLVAKIAAGFKKPDGLFLVSEKNVEKFLEKLSVRELPGVGPKTEQLLNERKIFFVKDLKEYSKEQLDFLFGKCGEEMYFKAKGQDSSPIEENYEVKSIGEQTTFNENTSDSLVVGEKFAEVSKDVFRRFLQSDFKSFKNITIVVRFSNFKTKNFSKTLDSPILRDEQKKFEIEALKMLLPFLDRRKNPQESLIRLIGLRIEKLSLI